MSEEITKYPKYYVIDEERGLELQWLQDNLTGHLHGGEAINIGNVIKYIVRYGKKEPGVVAKRSDIKKMITYLVETDKKLEVQEAREKASIVAPDEWIEDPLHDED
jgi:hypothetical protein